MKNKRIKQGFTLVELLVVVLIIGILAAVALPQYQWAVEKARASEAISLMKQIAAANELYFMENGDYAQTLDDLVIEIPGEVVNQDRLRKATAYFAYDVRHTSGAVAKAIAQRRPGTNDYYFQIDPGKDSIICVEYDTNRFKGICKKLSNGKMYGSYYIID